MAIRQCDAGCRRSMGHARTPRWWLISSSGPWPEISASRLRGTCTCRPSIRSPELAGAGCNVRTGTGSIEHAPQRPTVAAGSDLLHLLRTRRSAGSIKAGPYTTIYAEYFVASSYRYRRAHATYISVLVAGTYDAMHQHACSQQHKNVRTS